MQREKPLLMRLYQQPALYETARAIGYGGCPRDQLEKRIEPLVQRFGRNAVDCALWDLTNYSLVPSAQPVVLKVHVKPLCWQLLGPPPDHAEYRHYHPDDRPEEPQPKPKGRTRKK